MLKILLIICVFSNSILGKPTVYSNLFVNENVEISTCGYESCNAPLPDMLNVHLVPHTHDDVGWLKTVDQYYYGSRTNIQRAGVQYILDSAITELLADKNRKFIYVESAFLWKWWKEQSDHRRHQVKALINNGQLEIIGGAWSMNDEATTHYQSTIDQFTWGFRFLNDTFGACGRPKIGWQIDPFGHSREMASMFAQFGFDGLLFGRLDYQDKNQRMKTKTGEMIWKGSANLGSSAELFTSVLYNQYQPPPGFCFDVLCSDEPIIDDKESRDYNVEKRWEMFETFVKKQALSYKSNNIILTMGEDFNYQDAHMWYKNLDKLIKYANERQKQGSNINVFYSTPSCYIKAVHDSNQQWPTKSDDFFPYSSDPHAFWTGYFTSRPTIKYYERFGNKVLQVAKQLGVVENESDRLKGLKKLREAMGIMQHHDAVTGTEKQHVAEDYAAILSHAIDKSLEEASVNLNLLLTSKKETKPQLDFEMCHLLNISQCSVSEDSKNFVVVLYNPSSRNVTQYARVPVTGQHYSVRDPNGNYIETQLIPIAQAVQAIPGRVSAATNELVFVASYIPPLGYKSYFISLMNSTDPYQHTSTANEKVEGPLGNENTKVHLNSKSGTIKGIKFGTTEIPLSQSFAFYEGAVGDNREFKNRSSGAYIFRPNGTIHTFNLTAENKVYRGPIVDELHQTYNSWVSQIVRIYHKEDYAEFDWIIGPISIDDNIGKEIVTRFTTDIKSEGIFYTDSNGREMLQRKRNHRDTWELELEEPVAGNYYPVTSCISLRDSNNLRLSVLNDRAQGGGSLNDGELEIMVHRRLLNDDAFGVGEALNETAYGLGLVARGQHFIIGGTDENSSPTLAAKERILAQKVLLSPLPFFIRANEMSFKDFQDTYNLEHSHIQRPLPDNVQILTLEPWKNESILLRLEHFLEKDEDPLLSKPAVVDLANLFTTFKILSMRETTLGANQWLSEMNRLEWTAERLTYDNEIELLTNEIKTAFANDKNTQNKGKRPLQPSEISLDPMQIRTFILNVQYI